MIKHFVQQSEVAWLKYIFGKPSASSRGPLGKNPLGPAFYTGMDTQKSMGWVDGEMGGGEERGGRRGYRLKWVGRLGRQRGEREVLETLYWQN